MTAETYNKVFTLHGVIMVFLSSFRLFPRRWETSCCP